MINDTDSPSAFIPPPYPYDRLTSLAESARSVSGGMVDLSVGTPCDPAPSSVLEALAKTSMVSGYPTSVGSSDFRDAARGWMLRKFGVEVAVDQIAACVGTKELVATAPWLLRMRNPTKDTVLYPAVSYPTYAFGAEISGCRAVGVPELPGGGPDLSSVSEADSQRALLLWINSPSNPTGALTDMAPVVDWARRRSIPVMSDECYTEFTWGDSRCESVLNHGQSGLIVVHSLSKRSNMAGVRAGFYAGDADLVGYLSEVRKHLGLMVPGPVQEAAVAALNDDRHVEVQRGRYLRRLQVLAEALSRYGLDVTLPAGGFYLWVAAPLVTEADHLARISVGGDVRSGLVGGGPAVGGLAGSGLAGSGAETAGSSPDGIPVTRGWRLAEKLARDGGVLVSPGEFYGPGGSDFVRLAVVADDDRIALVAGRLESSNVRH